MVRMKAKSMAKVEVKICKSVDRNEVSGVGLYVYTRTKRFGGTTGGNHTATSNRADQNGVMQKSYAGLPSRVASGHVL